MIQHTDMVSSSLSLVGGSAARLAEQDLTCLVHTGMIQLKVTVLEQ
jgi:hypothetical protein